jgi:hypothetical protein
MIRVPIYTDEVLASRLAPRLATVRREPIVVVAIAGQFALFPLNRLARSHYRKVHSVHGLPGPGY